MFNKTILTLAIKHALGSQGVVVEVWDKRNNELAFPCSHAFYEEITKYWKIHQRKVLEAELKRLFYACCKGAVNVGTTS